jgi:hypothetical protein
MVYPVKLNVTEKENEVPAAIGPGPDGRDEFSAWKRLLPMVKSFIDLRTMFVVHTTFEVAKLPIDTEPKSTGVQVKGRATGDP